MIITNNKKDRKKVAHIFDAMVMELKQMEDEESIKHYNLMQETEINTRSLKCLMK